MKFQYSKDLITLNYLIENKEVKMERKKFIGIILIVIAVVVIISLVIYFKPVPDLSKQTSYRTLTPVEAIELIEIVEDLIIIDVSPYYAKGHLPGAINYPLEDGTLDKVIPTLDKDTIYIVYCHAFSASSSGAQKLVDAGFINVYRLEGEYGAWVKAGYSIEK
jgi:rhodanese-related sulfurtransferase